MLKADHTIKIEYIMGKIRTFQAGATLEMIGIEINILQVRGETLRPKTGHIIEAEAVIEITEEYLTGLEETADLGIKVDPCLGIKVKRQGVITGGNQDILYVSIRKTKEIKINKGDKRHKCMK